MTLPVSTKSLHSVKNLGNKHGRNRPGSPTTFLPSLVIDEMRQPLSCLFAQIGPKRSAHLARIEFEARFCEPRWPRSGTKSDDNKLLDLVRVMFASGAASSIAMHRQLGGFGMWHALGELHRRRASRRRRLKLNPQN